MKFKDIKIGAIALSLCMIAGVTGCTSQAQTFSDNQITVLPNQQAEINNTLKLQRVDDIKLFRGNRWVDDDWVLGYVKDDVKGETLLNLYNTVDKRTITIGKNLYGGRPSIQLTHINAKGERLIVYKNCDDNDTDTFIYNMHTDEKLTIPHQFYRYTEVVDDKFSFIDYKDRIYHYDLNTFTQVETVLPDEFRKTLLSFDVSYEDYIASIIPDKSRRDILSDDDVEQYKLMHQRYKADNHIDRIEVQSDNIYLCSYSNIGFFYNTKTKEYSQTDYEYDDYAYLHMYRRGVIKQDEAGRQHGLVEVDKDGVIVNIIDDSTDIYDIRNSDNNKRIAYFTQHPTEDSILLNVYEFDTKRSINITPESFSPSMIRWNKDGTKFLILNQTQKYQSAEDTVIFAVE